MNNICPNIKNPSWIALEKAVGRFEALRDWMDHKGEIRSPEEVRQKLDERDAEYADIIAQKEAEESSVDPLKEFKKELKISKKELSTRERASINSRVRSINQKLGTSFYVKFKPVGQADLWTWEIQDMAGGRSRQTTMFFRDMTLNELAEQMVDIGTMSIVDTDQARASEIATKLSQELASQLGVDYQFVTVEQASDITKKATNPWNGEAAFFIGDTVYFVGTNINTEKVFHEFSHPLMRAISKSNNTLFNSLYQKLQGQPEGLAIIEQVKGLYTELQETDDLFKEEALVRALTKDAENRFLKQSGSTGFTKFISDLMYAIKQLIRKVFGQGVDISKLSSDTNINDLGKMLTSGKNFVITTEQVSDNDTVAYVRDQQSYIDDMMKVSAPELQALTNRGFDIASKHVEVVLKNKNYSEMVNILADEYNRGDLQEIRKNLSAYKSDLLDKTEKLGKDIEYTKNHASSLINTMFRLENMAEKIRLHMEDISKQPDNIDNLHKAYYYDYLLKYWKQFIAEAKDNIDKNNISTSSPLAQLVSRIDRSLDRSKKLTN
jgi:hypothetical protein